MNVYNTPSYIEKYLEYGEVRQKDLAAGSFVYEEVRYETRSRYMNYFTQEIFWVIFILLGSKGFDRVEFGGFA